MRDGLRITTARPQIAHKLSQRPRHQIVDKLCIKILLLVCNSPRGPWDRLYGGGNLPTMKLQLSQLPLIVGSGRVVTRRALFSWGLPFEFNHLSPPS